MVLSLELSPSLLEAVITHISLPPKLPTKQDPSLHQIEKALGSYAVNASVKLRDLLPANTNHDWDSIRNVVQTCLTLNSGGVLDRTSLLGAFDKLDHKNPLILHVAKQKAGLLIRKAYDTERSEEVIIFESFEASALSEQVLATEGALQWDFPGVVVAVPSTEFHISALKTELGSFLQQASVEHIPKFVAHARKAGSLAVEVRETVNPSLITDILTALLEANGSRMTPTHLRKRIRDDVCWAEGAEKPWRRSPFWLVLRVGLGRHLAVVYGGEPGRIYYKIIFCMILVLVLEDSVEKNVRPDLIIFLNAKLGRRLAKLEGQVQHASSDCRIIRESVLPHLRWSFSRRLDKAKEHVEAVWKNHKHATLRVIRPLPRRSDERNLILSLHNSYPYLQQILSQRSAHSLQAHSYATHQRSSKRGLLVENKFTKLANHHYTLTKLEDDIAKSWAVPNSDHEVSCIAIAQRINSYLEAVGESYDSNPEQKSIMLLTVMRLWVALDKCAVKAFTLLEEYDPGIPSTMLDVLQLSSLKDLADLQNIQDYLEDRRRRCDTHGRTIFRDPTEGCFAERYFDKSRDSEAMALIYDRINAADERAREEKYNEWERLTAEYEKLHKEMMQSTCLYTHDSSRAAAVHDDRNCRKCKLERKTERMRIGVHEDPLPADLVHAKAVVFELHCPKAFRLYRNTTWRILGSLGRSAPNDSQPPRLLLSEYSELQVFLPPAMSGGVSLASTTKSYLNTHYRTVHLPVGWESVCLNNGLKLGYFDSTTQQWTGRQKGSSSFAHHCEMTIPRDSPFASLHSLPRFAVGSSGPSSYEIIASQTDCPTGLSLHEFFAYQTLLSGTTRRWPTLLVELGSSNLNFSSEATSLLVSQLVLIAGPAQTGHPFRSVHCILRDQSFCEKLLGVIYKRILSLSSSWRESNGMAMLLVILLRLSEIAPHSITHKALELLDMVRGITAGWVRKLRDEIHRCTDAASSSTCSRYALSASLLCRKTFAMYYNEGSSNRAIELSAFQDYIDSSLALQQNLPNNLSSLPRPLGNALIWDIKMAFRLRSALADALASFPDGFVSTINATWHQTEELETPPIPQLLDEPHGQWVQWCSQATLETRSQTFLFHLLQGHLLIDGEPLGKLPHQYLQSVVVQQLFGKQSLRTYPSNLPGMTYMLAFPILDHHVYFGSRNNKLVIKALYKGAVLELIPPEIFRGSLKWDLPVLLVENCCHWLNLKEGTLEIRPQPDIWMSKASHWLLHVSIRRAFRRKSSLVDPHSQLFDKVAEVFRFFERPERLTVFQPGKGGLAVELRRLELSFFVNRRGLFQCRQLPSEIDDNQDAGTWHGLRSKLVLRDIFNKTQRSIIVPLGPIRYARNGCHVTVDVDNDSSYGRFIINDVLGRLDCPAEPRLVYSKVMFHAYTSFVLPDTLTGLTGAEEALRSLRSGYCRPWIPLSPGSQEALTFIAKLTPKREYYPTNMKFMQQVHWDPKLTMDIQHEEYLPLVSSISEISKTLALFTLEKKYTLAMEDSETSPRLHRRSLASLRRHQRCINHAEIQDDIPDLQYNSRCFPGASQSRRNAYEAASLVRSWEQDMCMIEDLPMILQDWPTIGGYGSPFQKTLLGDLLQANFGSEWGSMVTLCQMSSAPDKYKLMFMLAVMAFREDAPMGAVRSLISFAVSECLKAVPSPSWPVYIQFKYAQTPSVDYIEHITKPFGFPYPEDQRALFPGQIAFKMRRKLEEAERCHTQRVESDVKTFADFLQNQWPCQILSLNGLPSDLQVNSSDALKIILPEWLRLFQNFQLSQHLDEVKRALSFHRVTQTTRVPMVPVKGVHDIQTKIYSLPTLSSTISLSSRPINDFTPENSKVAGQSQSLFTKHRSPASPQVTITPGSQKADIPSEVKELRTIVDSFAQSNSLLEQKYGEDLLQSLKALEMTKWASPIVEDHTLSLSSIQIQVVHARYEVKRRFTQLSIALGQDDPRARWLKAGLRWPPATTITLLEQLRSTSKASIPPEIKTNLIKYALSITTLQRLLRIEDSFLQNDSSRLLEERRNSGHGNWKPVEHLDWLLLEIDANILIRDNQVDVALAMMSPPSGFNSALQMNMGQGKTSCIIPMVAAQLADTTRLVRIIVPKALLLQTAQLMQTRLGGLLGREVRHVPFARKTPATTDTLKAYFQIHKEIKTFSGVMIALPEHVLSFTLSGLQRLSDRHLDQARQMIKIQRWMEKVCRDILDECDFTLSTRTQLIYPSGTQATVDGHPHRWEIAQTLLHAVEGHLWNLHFDFPLSMEIVHRQQGGFPMVFFLRRDVEQELINRLVNDILDGQIVILPTQNCSTVDLQTIRDFISNENLQPASLEAASLLFPDKPAARQALYLLRGLLVHRILLLSLKKRWNVQYGLHPLRDPIAVPFHSKGVPSEQAEWGHLDVAILLTCLAFYFGGLEVDQLRQSLEQVLKSDDPASGYDRWTHQSETLPDSLREWNVINVEDPVQMMELWTYLRYNVIVIDYHLNHFVFPAHAKQFRFKLQASGWDIPLISPSGEGIQTTGFSGTNDNRVMLPLTIRQDDLPSLRHTNAEVLTYLLQPRNRLYMVAADQAGRHLTENDLLKMLYGRNIRVLIDAGAQVLEMDNLSLVKAWLKVDHEAPAAIYFNQDNKALVLYRHGSIVPLVASPYADDLSDCLVYLDEAHTRGTDLKMPSFARGALTLSLGQTKDHTIQAAMRLRQLGSKQSITWVAPPEVHQSILDLRYKEMNDSIDSHDVIYWLLKQTCVGIEQLQPLYFSQGVDFCRRTESALINKNFPTDDAHRLAHLEILRCSEQQTLEDLYGPRGPSKSAPKHRFTNPQIKGFLTELQTRRKGFQDFGNAVHGSVLQEVEQEREVAFEVEAVRQAQKPVHYSPLRFPGLDEGILQFLRTGRLELDGRGWESASVILMQTVLGKKLEINVSRFRSRLFVSRQFMRTVQLPPNKLNDDFLRPINWVLWSTATETAMIIIPEEAEELLPILQKMQNPPTHLLTYAAPVTRSMLAFNDLNYYALPSLAKDWKPPQWLILELGILAGRLYFQFEEYADICRYFGLQTVDVRQGQITQETSHTRQSRIFSGKPLSFLQKWLSVRRKGQDFTHTPMGYVCQSKTLTADHPFFGATENQIREGKIEKHVQSHRNVAGTSDEAHEQVEFDVDIDDIYDSDVADEA